MCVSSSIRESQLKSSSINMDDFKATMKQELSFDASGPCIYQESVCSTDVSSSEDDGTYHHETSNEEYNNEFIATRSTYRSVHFDVDDNDAIIEYHYVYPKNECVDSYTPGDEQENNASQLRRECSQMKRSNSQLIHRLNDIYENEEYGNDTKIFNEWVASDLRGFESKFISESEFQVRAYVESAIIYYRHIQDVYSQASTYGEIEFDIDDKLRSLIIKNSQRSSEIAIRLAAADEIEAQQLL